MTVCVIVYMFEYRGVECVGYGVMSETWKQRVHAIVCGVLQEMGKHNEG